MELSSFRMQKQTVIALLLSVVSWVFQAKRFIAHNLGLWLQASCSDECPLEIWLTLYGHNIQLLKSIYLCVLLLNYICDLPVRPIYDLKYLHIERTLKAPLHYKIEHGTAVVFNLHLEACFFWCMPVCLRTKLLYELFRMRLFVLLYVHAIDACRFFLFCFRSVVPCISYAHASVQHRFCL